MKYFFSKQSITFIIVGVLGCFLTSTTGIAAVMFFDGWNVSGGVYEFFRRLGIAYPSACITVVTVFPGLMPFLMKKFK